MRSCLLLLSHQNHILNRLRKPNKPNVILFKHFFQNDSRSENLRFGVRSYTFYALQNTEFGNNTNNYFSY